MRPMALSLVVGGVWLAALGTGAASPQGLSGVQANWKDLETWSRVIDSSKENELGLGLQPTGGAVVAFLGRLSHKDPTRAPAEVRVHAAVAYMANPNLLRTRTLVFLADNSTPRRVRLDASGPLVTDDISPGGVINNTIGPIPVADFLRLTRAETLTANVLGFDVVFRPDQIRAMKAFGERLHLK